MTPEKRRQSILLGGLAVSIAAYFILGTGGSGGGGVFDSAPTLPAIDAEGLTNDLMGVSTVDPKLIPIAQGESEADRNLFQYGQRKPPPPSAEELERRRLAEEARLKQQEEEAKRQKELQRQRELAAQKAREEQIAQQAEAPPRETKPAAPVKPPPPSITFKFRGIVGPAKQPVGVFMDGEEILLRKKGQVIKKEFKILDIGVEWADIGYTNPEHKDEKKRLLLGV